MNQMLARLFANAIIVLTRLVTAVQAHWVGCGPEQQQRIYFANHVSHGDFVLIWTVLPPAMRKITRPIAGADYWLIGCVRRFIAVNVFHSVLIDRKHPHGRNGPIGTMTDAIGEGQSLILFPEGTRNLTDAPLLPFKAGIHHLATRCPDIEFVPVWIANLNRVLPKGEILPVPVLCTVTFGTPIKLIVNEPRGDFLDRARGALLSLAPDASGANR